MKSMEFHEQYCCNSTVQYCTVEGPVEGKGKGTVEGKGKGKGTVEGKGISSKVKDSSWIFTKKNPGCGNLE